MVYVLYKRNITNIKSCYVRKEYNIFICILLDISCWAYCSHLGYEFGVVICTMILKKPNNNNFCAVWRLFKYALLKC